MYQLFVRKPCEEKWEFVALYYCQKHAVRVISELHLLGCETKWVDYHTHDVVH